LKTLNLDFVSSFLSISLFYTFRLCLLPNSLRAVDGGIEIRESGMGELEEKESRVWKSAWRKESLFILSRDLIELGPELMRMKEESYDRDANTNHANTSVASPE